MTPRSLAKKLVPWRYRHRLRRLQQWLRLRRDARVPLHGGHLAANPDPAQASTSASVTSASTDSAAAAWDEKHANDVGSSWIENPIVMAALQARQTGDPGRFWLNHLFEERLKEPVERVLSIGCGAGGHEILIASEGWARHIEAFDASPAGIEKARAEAERLGLAQLDFSVRTFEDFAASGPDAPTYDVVLFAGSLHHVRDLEGVLSRVRRCLKREGRLLFSEYVGPTYAIYPPERVALLNRLLDAIPAEYKRAPDVCWHNPTIDDVMRLDPSEGVRSGILLDVLGMYFDFEWKQDFGGAILHPIFDLLDGPRLADGSAGSQAVVSLLIEVEDLLMAQGTLPSDMCLGICRHKG